MATRLLTKSLKHFLRKRILSSYTIFGARSAETLHIFAVVANPICKVSFFAASTLAPINRQVSTTVATKYFKVVITHPFRAIRRLQRGVSLTQFVSASSSLFLTACKDPFVTRFIHNRVIPAEASRLKVLLLSLSLLLLL